MSSVTIKAYQTDVWQYSDAELYAMSEEMEEAFTVSTECGSEWTDDEAEVRNHEITTELRRRFMLANPDWKQPTVIQISEYARIAMDALKENIRVSALMDLEMYGGDTRGKIGDHVSVRKPTRFTGC